MVSDSDRRAIRIALEHQFGRSIKITAAMIDAVAAGLDTEQDNDDQG
jgi:hypothetical protein